MDYIFGMEIRSFKVRYMNKDDKWGTTFKTGVFHWMSDEETFHYKLLNFNPKKQPNLRNYYFPNVFIVGSRGSIISVQKAY